MKLTASIKKSEFKDLEKISKNLRKLSGSYVEVGYFDGEIHEDSEMSYASLMTILEFGTADIPARYPFSMVAQEHKPSSKKVLKDTIKKHITMLATKDSSKELLEYLGNYYEKELTSLFGNPARILGNAKRTIQMKGKDTPLVDTGDLRDSLSHRIGKERD